VILLATLAPNALKLCNAHYTALGLDAIEASHLHRCFNHVASCVATESGPMLVTRRVTIATTRLKAATRRAIRLIL